jgi:hypothetical protein
MEWQNLYAQMSIMVLGMGLEGEAMANMINENDVNSGNHNFNIEILYLLIIVIIFLVIITVGITVSDKPLLAYIAIGLLIESLLILGYMIDKSPNIKQLLKELTLSRRYR